MKYLTLLTFLIVTVGCTTEQNDPERIVQKTIEISGGDNYNNNEIEFEFRDREYGAVYKDGKFEFVRIFRDSADVVRDVLNNDGFHREINGHQADVLDSMAAKYTNSVNSVIYFALLPHGLADEAVNKEYLEEVTLKDKKYHKIRVTFDQQGGGEDYQDIFIYWINTENNKIDYMAYSYEVDGGGIRFREAYNERMVGGIRFVDYVNYKPAEGIRVEDTGKEFEADRLKELSRIELEKIKVNPL